MPSLAGGGAERAMLHLADGLVERGHKVDLVLVRAQGPYAEIVPEGVNVVDLNCRRIATSFRPLVQYLKSEQPAVMLSALKSTNCVATWARWLSAVDMRLFVCEHNNLSESTSNSIKWQDRVLPLLMRMSYARTDGVVAVSQGVADDLVNVLGLSRPNIQVIYNPVVTASLEQWASAPLDNGWFAQGSPPVIVAAGRLTAQKDFPSLIRGFAKLSKSRKARLMIIGEGEDRPDLESLVHELGLSDDVAMPGFVENPYKYMANASVFVLSSRWEGLPLVLIEAMACGSPVVATDCPSGPREILEDGKWGKLVPMQDPAELASAIEQVLDEGGCDARPRAAQFSVSRAVDQYAELLHGPKGCPDSN